MGSSYGLDAEKRRREITAAHGVPDFVFRPTKINKGSGPEELGDFHLWIDGLIAIVEHKARDPVAAARESQAQRRRWLDDKIREANRQIQRTASTLQGLKPGSVTLESERGVRVPWDPDRIEAYVGVVLIDGPEPDDDYGPAELDGGVPTIVMLARDWDRLNVLLPSTASLIRHVIRRLNTIPRCPVGSELDVFALLLANDHTGERIVIPEAGLPKDTFDRTLAEHPDWFIGGHPDDRFGFVVDSMIEGAADSDPAFSDTADPLDYLRIVAFLDKIPLLTRVNIGREVVERGQRVAANGGEICSRIWVPHGLLVVLINDHERQQRAEWLRTITTARHSQALDAGAPDWIETLGVATEPIPSLRGRSHDYAYISGGIRSDAEFRRKRDELFGAVDFGPLVEGWRTGGLNSD